MTYAAERAAIETRFRDAWSATTIAWPNVPFTPPATAWVRFRVLSGAASNETLANGVAYPGIIDIGIFVPEGIGTGQAATLADAASAIFSNQRFSGVTCGAAYAIPVGESDGWHQVTVTVPYIRR